MTSEKILELAEIVDTAAMSAVEIELLTPRYPELTIEDAYAVQDASMLRRFERGEALVGMKLGLTSRAKMEQVGVHEPIIGHLTTSMVLNDGGVITLGEFCHPRAEPEVAFILAEDLYGPVTPAQALGAVLGVAAAIEIIDSRYKDFKFTLPDVVADNTSASRFVLGSEVIAPELVNLGNLGIIFEVNGRVVEIGSSAAVLEHPARALAELANVLARRGRYLEAGQIILSGGATAAVALNPGDHVRAVIDEIGAVEFSVGASVPWLPC